MEPKKAKTEEFMPITLHCRKGDIITSRIGVIQESVSGANYLVKKFRVCGQNLFEVLSEKEKIGDFTC